MQDTVPLSTDANIQKLNYEHLNATTRKILGQCSSISKNTVTKSINLPQKKDNFKQPYENIFVTFSQLANGTVAKSICISKHISKVAPVEDFKPYLNTKTCSHERIELKESGDIVIDNCLVAEDLTEEKHEKLKPSEVWSRRVRKGKKLTLMKINYIITDTKNNPITRVNNLQQSLRQQVGNYRLIKVDKNVCYVTLNISGKTFNGVGASKRSAKLNAAEDFLKYYDRELKNNWHPSWLL